MIEPDLMGAEWTAWRDVCSELGARGLDVNDPANERVMKAVRLWGERLVSLRRGQHPAIRAGALDEAEHAYTPSPVIVAQR